MQIQPLNLSSRHECNFSGRPQTLASLRIKRNNFRDWIVESGRSRRHRFSRPDPIGFVWLEALVACAQAALTRKHKASLKRTLITTFYIFFHVPGWGNPRWRVERCICLWLILRTWRLLLSWLNLELDTFSTPTRHILKCSQCCNDPVVITHPNSRTTFDWKYCRVSPAQVYCNRGMSTDLRVYVTHISRYVHSVVR